MSYGEIRIFGLFVFRGCCVTANAPPDLNFSNSGHRSDTLKWTIVDEKSQLAVESVKFQQGGRFGEIS